MQIDKGIPLPKLAPKSKYAFLEGLAIGDSCLLKASEYRTSHLHTYATRIGIRLAVRAVEQPGMVRVWRVPNKQKPKSKK